MTLTIMEVNVENKQTSVETDKIKRTLMSDERENVCTVLYLPVKITCSVRAHMALLRDH